jgi:hypothetical protein
MGRELGTVREDGDVFSPPNQALSVPIVRGVTENSFRLQKIQFSNAIFPSLNRKPYDLAVKSLRYMSSACTHLCSAW